MSWDHSCIRTRRTLQRWPTICHLRACSHPLIKELSLYDVVGTEGVAADLGHIDSDAKVFSAWCSRLWCPFLLAAAVCLLVSGLIVKLA